MLIVATLLTGATGCAAGAGSGGDGGAPFCEQGDTAPCACGGGGQGVATCRDDGTGFGKCSCDDIGSDSDVDSDGDGDTDTGTGTGADLDGDTDSDTGTDSDTDSDTDTGSGSDGDGGTDGGPVGYGVGGLLSGLEGSITLELNGDEALEREVNGLFEFETRLETGDSYAVTVTAEPPLQACEVTAGEGVMGAADVNSVRVVCSDRRPEQVAYAKASNAGADDTFGWCAAMSGPRAVVGAVWEESAATGVDGLESDDSAIRAGAAYVFFDGTGGWDQEAYLKASNTEAEDRFGTSVAIDGDLVVVGAIHESSAATTVDGDEGNGAPQAGAAYVFRRAGGLWDQEAYLKPTNTDPGDYFGHGVAASGDAVAVGAINESSNATGVGEAEDDDSAVESGAAYIFRRSGGVWSQEEYFKASNTDPRDGFGFSVALDGDTLVVGAPDEDSASRGVGAEEDDDTAFSAGAVYVFRRTAGVWDQEAYLKATNADPGDNFGHAVSLDGDRLCVGAPYEQSAATGVDGIQGLDNADRSGAVYIFERDGTDWTQTTYVKASNTEANDFFGWSVSCAGDMMAVGAYGEDSRFTGVDALQDAEGSDVSGAVYLFRHDGDLWFQDAYIKASNTDFFDNFGYAVALGAGSLLVASPYEDSASQGIGGVEDDESAGDSGAVYFFSVP